MFENMKIHLFKWPTAIATILTIFYGLFVWSVWSTRLGRHSLATYAVCTIVIVLGFITMKRILEYFDRRLNFKSEVPLRQRFGSYLYEGHHHMIALFGSLCLGTFGWVLSTDTYGQQSIVPLFVGLVAGGTLYAILRLYFRVTDHFNKEGN